MPIHEYLCDDCGSKFEKLVRSSQASAEVECPSCGEAHVTQQLSTFAAHASGSSRDAMPSCPSGMCGTPGLCGRN
jgi:putative FmdB family regulatory protein